jgi:hypothetical protein
MNNMEEEIIDTKLLSKNDRKSFGGMFDKIFTTHYRPEEVERRNREQKREKWIEKRISKFGLD